MSQTLPAMSDNRKEESANKPHIVLEVQGLRALAVLLVATYHIWLGRVSGGVDIFLLISAFLMTGSFVRKVESGKPLALLTYWGNVLKRLLPAASIVLLAVLVGAYFFMPTVRWPDIISQTWASLFYRQNWQLAAQAIDYQAANFTTASPLQHFWSLSIQGQIFLLWPLIFVLCAVVSRLCRVRYRIVLAVVFALVFAFSLIFSIHETSTNQAFAYYDTRARLWEFALGSLLALILPWIKVPRYLRAVMSAVGLVLIVSCGLVLTVQTMFPGYVALWPLLGAALVIVAGSSGLRWGPDRLLRLKPLTKLGDASYALYLWHWPILIFWLIIVQPKEKVTFPEGFTLLAISIVLAILTTKLVETPVRQWRWPKARVVRSVAIAAGFAVVVALPLSAWQLQIQATRARAAQQTVVDNPGAASLDSGFTYRGSQNAVVKPLGTDVENDWGSGDEGCEGSFSVGNNKDIYYCMQQGDPAHSTKKILMIGNSHMQQWLGAMEPISQKNNWAVAGLIKPGCRFDQDCDAFIAAAQNAVRSIKPDLVIVLGTLTDWGTPREELVPGLEKITDTITEQGIPVLALRDNPRFSFNMAECVSKHGPSSSDCQVPQSDLFAPVNPLVAASAKLPGVHMADLTQYFCPQGMCKGAIGNVMVYMDLDHVTRTYMQTLAPDFEYQILAATGWKGNSK